MTRLGDVATYINGFAFKPDDWSEEGLPIIRIQDLTGNSYQMNRYAGDYNPKYEVNRGDVLISWSASLGVYVWQGEKALLNQHIFKVVFDKCEVDRSFYVHQVAAILEKAASQAHGATMKHLTKPVFDALPFYLPDLPTQQRIADTLDKVSEGIEVCRKMLGELDLMVKAKFGEMFGDPTGNSFNLSVKPMTEVCEIIDGDRGKNYPNADEFSDEGYCLFLNAKNVTASGFNFDNCMYITKEKDDILRKGKLSRGDVVLTTRGTIGNLAFYTSDIPYEHMRINSGMVILRMNQKIINEVFFIEQFKMLLDGIKQKIASGSAQPQLPISAMREINLLLPDIEQQKIFSEFVAKSNKSRLTLRQVLSKIELEQKVLMQKYFG